MLRSFEGNLLGGVVRGFGFKGIAVEPALADFP